MESFSANLGRWKDFYDLMNPQNAALPEPWDANLTTFQKLIVMRIIRADKITAKVVDDENTIRKNVLIQSYDL